MRIYTFHQIYSLVIFIILSVNELISLRAFPAIIAKCVYQFLSFPILFQKTDQDRAIPPLPAFSVFWTFYETISTADLLNLFHATCLLLLILKTLEKEKLTHFMPLAFFNISWKHQKTRATKLKY